ncbi:MAG: periplasmic heavy metal sensor [Methyloligellaceae bacterium]
MSNVTETEMAPRKPKLLKWLFIISLSFNLLLVGLIGGAIWMRLNGGLFDRLTTQFVKTLPEEKQNRVSYLFDKNKKDVQEQWGKIFLGQQKVIDVLKKDTYDSAELDQQLEELLKHHDELQRIRHQLVVDLAEKLTLKERRTFIDMWNNAMSRFRKLFPRTSKSKSAS